MTAPGRDGGHGESAARTVLVPTPLGPARVITDAAADPVATLVLGHGAGGGAEAPDLVALAAALPGEGITVVRVEQPWRVAGRRVAPAPATLDRAWLAVVPGLGVDGPLVCGGRSAGARVACRTAEAVAAAVRPRPVAVLALAFPLHPPGRPGRSRAGELLETGVPTLVVQGERDAFGAPGEFPAGVDVRGVAGADHSFAVRGPAPARAQALAALAATVAGWITAGRPLVRPRGPGRTARGGTAGMDGP